MEPIIENLMRAIANLDAPDPDMDRKVLSFFNVVSSPTKPDPIVGREDVNYLGGATYVHPAPITKNVDAALALVSAMAGFKVSEILSDSVKAIDNQHRGGVVETAERRYREMLARCIVFYLLKAFHDGEV
jgi:hypothetical protein